MKPFLPVVVPSSVLRFPRGITMKLPFFLIVSIIVGTTTAQDFTASDIQMVFDNDRVFRLYFGCLTGEITCTPKGKNLKDILPRVLSNGCADCSDQQRTLAKAVVIRMKQDRAAEWAKLKKLYDPQNVYGKKLENFLLS